jgi:cytochrome b pre-mRNA-processing protein 3
MRAAATRAVRATTAARSQRSASALVCKGLGASSIRSQRACAQILALRGLASAAAAQPQILREDTRKFAWAETDIAPPSPGRGIMGRSANVDVTKSSNPIQRWHWLWKLLGFLNEDDRLFRHSTAVFQSCMNLTAKPEYYRALGLPRSFRAQQALLMAHVWLVHRRLALEGEPGKVMQELMFDRLWEETVVRIRYLDISELTVNKHLAQVQQVCFNACIAYDQGLKNGPNALQTAVAQHLLENETPEGLRIASIMAEYMKRELKNLEKIDANYIMEGTIPWSKLPETHVKATEIPGDDDDVVLIGQVFGNWRSALDNRGKLYYWNMTTRYSVWDRPTGDKLHEGEEQQQK